MELAHCMRQPARNSSSFNFFSLVLLLLSVFICTVHASDFGTSDIYTASIVAARNNIPVLLFRDAQCKFCPKVEDFLVGLGAEYLTVKSLCHRRSSFS